MKNIFVRISLSIILIIISINGCKKDGTDPILPLVDDRIPFELNFLEYSDNSYFIDSVYTDTNSALNMFNRYYGSTVPVILLEYLVQNIEVYISANTIVPNNIQTVIADAYLNLPPRSPSELYPDSFRGHSNVIPGYTETTRFKLLSPGADYIFHSETGYITFLFPVPEDRAIAVAYRVSNPNPVGEDIFYGEFFSELIENSKTSAVLKLIKPRNLLPQYSGAWQLKMKNIYKITSQYEQIADLDFDIYLKRADGSESNTINNIRLLELFGFDKIKSDGTIGPDGIFDGRKGINYEPKTAEIIFPVIQPFGYNIPALLESYQHQAIYDTMKVLLSVPGNTFVIKGKYRPI